MSLIKKKNQKTSEAIPKGIIFLSSCLTQAINFGKLLNKYKL